MLFCDTLSQLNGCLDTNQMLAIWSGGCLVVTCIQFSKGSCLRIKRYPASSQLISSLLCMCFPDKGVPSGAGILCGAALLCKVANPVMESVGPVLTECPGSSSLLLEPNNELSNSH